MTWVAVGLVWLGAFAVWVGTRAVELRMRRNTLRELDAQAARLRAEIESMACTDALVPEDAVDGCFVTRCPRCGAYKVAAHFDGRWWVVPAHQAARTVVL